MRKIILFMLLVIVMPFVLAGSVTRSFSSTSVVTGTEIGVSLIVDVGEGEGVYAIEEALPSGYQLVDDGGGVLAQNKLRWLEFSNVVDVTYTYKLKFSNTGIKTFSGTYAIDNSGNLIIGGSDKVTVVAGTGGSDGTGGGIGGGGIGGGEVSPCNPAWDCFQWGSCVNNKKTRTCSDLNNCGTNVGRPELETACAPGEVGETGEETPKTAFTVFLIIIISIIIIIISLIIYLVVKRAREQ